jgi:AsmA protein
VKIAKFILLGVAGLVLLAVLSIAAALMIVDGAFVKSRLERMMKEKNRTLVIEGVPSLRLFPVAGIALGKMSLSEPGGGKSFVALESAEVALRVLPLLSGELAIETLKVTGLTLNVVRRKDGTLNFSDLAGAPDKDRKAKSSQRPALRVAELDISKVQLAYRDEASGQELNVADLSLKSGRLDGQTPGDLALSLRVTGKRPEVDLRAQAAGALSFNLRRDEFGFDKFTAQLKGRVDRDSIAAEFAAPKLLVSAGRASGSEVKGSLQLRGTRNLDLSYTASFSGPPLAADFTAKLDESNIKAKIELADLAPLKANFDLNVDRINVDRYLPPERRDADQGRPIDLSVLKDKTLTGKAALGTLVYRRAKLENVKAEVKLAGGKLEVSPHSANLYGGTLAGALSVDADGNKIAVQEKVQNVAVGSLLRDVTQKDFVEGRGNLALDLQSNGANVLAMRKALAGNARVDMKEGAIKGVNLAEAVRKGGGTQKTEFTDLSATLKVSKGVARNDDLKANSPLLKLAGAGNLDIGNNGIDYLARATLVRGVAVPVKVYGALDAPSYSVDYTALAGGVIGGTAGTVTDTVKKGASGAGDVFRGLFKR